jgi:hypothetical protein
VKICERCDKADASEFIPSVARLGLPICNIKKKYKGDKKGKMEETQFEIIILVIGAVIGLITGVLAKYVQYKYFTKQVGEDGIWDRYQNKHFEFLENFNKINLQINIFRLTVEIMDIAFRLSRGEERSRFPPKQVIHADGFLQDMPPNPSRDDLQKKVLEKFNYIKDILECRKEMYDLYYRYEIYLPKDIAKQFDDYIGILMDNSKLVDFTNSEIKEKQDLITDCLLNRLSEKYAKKKETKNFILRK